MAQSIHMIKLDAHGMLSGHKGEVYPPIVSLLNVPRGGRLRFVVEAGSTPVLFNNTLRLCCNYPPKSSIPFQRTVFHDYFS